MQIKKQNEIPFHIDKSNQNIKILATPNAGEAMEQLKYYTVQRTG